MTDMLSLAGKTAMITGAGRGIGQAIAVRLAEAGADIAVCDLKADMCDETAKLVRDMGRRAETFEMDVSNSESVNAAVAAAIETFEQIHVLVNNAGITKDTLMPRMTDDAWDAVLNVNLRGTFVASRAVGKHMMKKRCGAIVNIASIIGLIGNAGQCNYAASKAGVMALTKSVAKELAGRNVRANAVAPGFIETPMTQKLPDDVRQQMFDVIPMKRFGTPQDVAEVVTFLASDASSYMTGQVVTVSGGMVM